MLHIINKSSLDRPTLTTVLRTVKSGAVLFIEDGVYCTTRGHSGAAGVRDLLGQLKVYALAPDLEARGIADRVLDGVATVDYGGFVDLVAEHPNCQSWL